MVSNPFRSRPDSGVVHTGPTRFHRVAAEIVARTERAAADLPVETDVVRVGSTARGTWVAGDRDIDVFVRFPPAVDRDDLRSYGLAVGHAVLPDGDEEYAEHPYVAGTHEGFAVDIVPCYRVETAVDAQSAVDRTPFHTEFLAGRIGPVADDVRLCKGFTTAVGIYGSDLQTRGYSGYLTELLVLHYGGFRGLIEAAADWHPPVRFDPADHGTKTFDHPLVVVDPTDPERNVAAVVAPENVARLQHYARALLARPRESLFEPYDPAPLGPAAIRGHLDRRGTTPVALRFDAPDLVDDELHPQLEKSRTGIVDELDRRGFDPLRSTVLADTDAAILVELAVARRPAIERHEGPPVAVRDHATDFHDIYADDAAAITADGERDDPPDESVYGPFVAGDRYVVERPRAVTDPRDVLGTERLYDVALGPAVEAALREGHDLLVGDEVAALADRFGTELARYFAPRP
ncbi:CCA tRNA nucleotidyltransferase [Halobacteriales archaeon SW_7_68_16]|nr:MAG: CCA tRNA nucleotidyltransferase [Halobacteriales archaeon SW_7_68_16]